MTDRTYPAKGTAYDGASMGNAGNSVASRIWKGQNIKESKPERDTRSVLG